METGKKIQVGIIEDNGSLRDGVALYLDGQEDLTCHVAVGSVEAFLQKAKNNQVHAPDVLLLDINLPGMDGTTGLPLLKAQFPDMSIIMLTINSDSDHIFKAMCNGATGYVLKGTPLAKIREAIVDVYNGGSSISPIIARKLVEYFKPVKKDNPTNNLTDKEQQVVQCLVDGLSYKLCADRLNITIETVRSHIKNIYRKLQVNSKSEVITKSLKGEI